MNLLLQVIAATLCLGVALGVTLGFLVGFYRGKSVGWVECDSFFAKLARERRDRRGRFKVQNDPPLHHL